MQSDGKLVTFLSGGTNVYISEESFKHEILDPDTFEITDVADVYGLYGYRYDYWSVDDGSTFVSSQTCPLSIGGFYFEKEQYEDAEILEKYLTDNNILYETEEHLNY